MWFRNDLRLHDHEALVAANQGGTSLLPVYCFDPREYGKVSWAGLWRGVVRSEPGYTTLLVLQAAT